MGHGAVVIAAITSCTNTSNPSVMVGGRAAGEESRRARPDGQAVCQDQPGARLAGGHRISAESRPARAAGSSWASTWSATAAPPASATPARCRARWSRPSPAPTWSRRRCSRATATSKGASTPMCGPTTWPRRRWWWPMPWPARSISTWPTSRSASDPDGQPVYLRDIWPTQPGSPARRSPARVQPEMFTAEICRRLRRQRDLE